MTWCEVIIMLGYVWLSDKKRSVFVGVTLDFKHCSPDVFKGLKLDFIVERLTTEMQILKTIRSFMTGNTVWMSPWRLGWGSGAVDCRVLIGGWAAGVQDDAAAGRWSVRLGPHVCRYFLKQSFRTDFRSLKLSFWKTASLKIFRITVFSVYVSTGTPGGLWLVNVVMCIFIDNIYC